MKYLYAFPTPPVDVGPHGIIHGKPGMLLRDFFAAHAPTEIPEWFSYSGPGEDEPEPPNREELPKKLKEEVNGWWRDPCWELSEEFPELAEFEAAAHRYWKELDEYRRKKRMALYIAWRWAYADAMLAMRGEAQP